MKPIKWVGSSRWLAAALVLLALCGAGLTQPLRPRQADVVFSPDLAPPPPGAAWRQVDLPFATDHVTAWYRIEFAAPANTDEPWAVYLPYLYRGGRLFLNGAPLARIPESGTETVIRWERPHLVTVPAGWLRPGGSQLMIRIPGTAVAHDRMPLPAIG